MQFERFIRSNDGKVKGMEKENLEVLKSCAVLRIRGISVECTTLDCTKIPYSGNFPIPMPRVKDLARKMLPFRGNKP